MKNHHRKISEEHGTGKDHKLSANNEDPNISQEGGFEGTESEMDHDAGKPMNIWEQYDREDDDDRKESERQRK